VNDGELLDRHGTKLFQLKPGSVVTAAHQDLKHHVQKLEGTRDQWDVYSFHRDHVRKARDAAELLALAIKDRDRGIRSGKRVTRNLYGDEHLLWAALFIERGIVARPEDAA
jgi:hypothetical protein